jgi:DNA-binding phage protein
VTIFDPAQDLSLDEAIAVFMEEAFKTGDLDYIAHTLDIAARAKGIIPKPYA